VPSAKCQVLNLFLLGDLKGGSEILKLLLTNSDYKINLLTDIFNKKIKAKVNRKNSILKKYN
jgi:hypothetical protein